MDTLIVKSLKVSTQIGVYAWEQRIKQPLLIDISIETHFGECRDDLASTINYATLCELVTEFVESRSFQLIETVANEVATLIKEQFEITKLTVAISKPHAVKNAENIQVIARR